MHFIFLRFGGDNFRVLRARITSRALVGRAEVRQRLRVPVRFALPSDFPVLSLGFRVMYPDYR
jgi:hypothetical protein